MLITTDKENELICELKEKGIDCYVVGEIIEEPKIEFINSSGEITLIDELPIDEIYKVV